ncbi:hypothetical protein PINS_up019049 [Pythium insidiosum]|nr:hypothetical protein PINS_up019049 [Pythium insidiosum]
MLRLRFSNATIAKRFLDADTNPKKDAFWCYFAAVLTEESGVVVSTKRLRDKYKKVKYEYRAYTEDVGRTGNQEPKSRPPRYLPILQEWFGNKTGAGSVIMFDSNESDKEVDVESFGEHAPEPKRSLKIEHEQKSKQGVNLLAQEMGRGMEAIAAAFKQAQPTQDIAGLLRSAQEENRSLMERMMQAQERHNELILQLINTIAKNQ